MVRWTKGLWLGAVCLALVLARPGLGRAQTQIYTFSAENVPVDLQQTAMQVSTQDVNISLTFAGDCTLGGETGPRSGARGFNTLVKKNGFGYPFAQLQPLFATDDLTLVNLEGVLSDETEDKEPGKLFHFIGPSEFGVILTEGSVECVNLANNHTRDYGMRGYEDTLQALAMAEVARVGSDDVTVLEKDGVRIGFTGSLSATGGSRAKTLDQQIQALRSVGCQWIAHSLHDGVEYAEKPSPRQRAMATALAEVGVNLMVGHHPHVVQGMDMVDGMPAVYSLGNCSFGGNLRPKDMDACLLRVELSFVGGSLSSMQLVFWPIRISGQKKVNDYQPVLLTGEDARRVMEKLQQSSSVELLPYQEGQGAPQRTVEYK